MRDLSLFWKRYWSRVNNAGHRYHTDDWLSFYARELLLYCPEKPVRVLELGCGNGALYRFLQPRFVSYVGIDFSPAMLITFKDVWADVNLVCADVSDIPISERTYDFIFSNQVCQYLNLDILQNNLDQVYHLLDANGVYLIANIPDAQLRLFYYRKALRGDTDINWLGPLRHKIESLIRRKEPGIGQWYSRRHVYKLAVERGFECHTFSSSSLEYRFHAVLKKRAL
jgi:SAM-dependent methyltransferase